MPSVEMGESAVKLHSPNIISLSRLAYPNMISNMTLDIESKLKEA